LRLLDILVRQTADAIERTLAQKALHDSEERYRSTFDNAAIGIAHVGLDGRWVRFNDAVCSITGYSREELLARTFADITHPDDIEPDWAHARRLLAGDISPYTMDKRYLHKHGGIIWINLTASLLRDETGRPTHFISVIQDITKRKQAEAALRESELKFRTLTEVSPQVVWTTDAAGSILYLNPYWVEYSGLTFEQMQALPPGAPVHSDDHARVMAVWTRSLQTGEPFSAEQRLRAADGSYRWFQGNGTPVRNERGEIEGWMGICADIDERKRAEEVLRLHMTQFETLLNQAPMGVYLVDADFRIVHVNPTALLVFGDIPDLLGGDFDEVIHRLWPQAYADELVTVFRHTLETGDPHIVPERIEQRLDRGIRECYEWRIDRIVLSDGRYGVVCYFRDISAQVQARETIAESEERFRTLADHMSQFAWTAAADGWINWYNRRWYDYTGTTLEEMQGWGWEKVHHPDHVARVVKSWKRSHATGEPWEDTFPLRSRDGEYRWFLSRAVPIRDEHNSIVRWFGTNTDVTERRAAEESSRERERFLSTVTGAAQVGLVVVEPGYVYRFANEAYAKIFELEDDQIVGRHVYELLSDGWPQIQPRLDRAFSGERVSYELTLSSKTGESSGPRYVAVSYEPHAEREGERTVVVVVVVDITTRKRAEEALRTSQEELRSLAGQLGQLVEERTKELVQSEERLRALATELNLTEQRERKRLATDLHDHLAQMLALGKMKLSQTRHIPDLASKCRSLIRDTDDILTQSLTYTRTLVADLAPPVLHDFGLPAGLKWLIAQMRNRHELIVTVHDSTDDLKLPEDQAVLLFQSVRELLINASKHAKSNEATVTLAQCNGDLRIEVRDHGTGFDIAAAAAAAASHTATAFSSKFGLFSIRERMRGLGGHFDLQSAPGKGTTATLSLPLSVHHETAGMSETSLDPQRASPLIPVSPVTPFLRISQSAHEKPRIRVLLVDDHAMVRQGLRTVLENYADIEVIGEASNGEEAVALAERLGPSLIVMDINMPKVNGIEATAAITSRYPGIIVIGLSVNASYDSAEAMKKAGAAVLLTKEAAVDELYRTIQNVLGKAEMKV
jgi:PAS domain S-box-containing protein